MTSRPGRSSSIPIPRSASSTSGRNIESLIPIPFVSPGRQAAMQGTSGRQPTEPRRVGPEGPRSVTTTHNISVSPVRSTARSVSLVSSVPGRTSSSRPPFEPRVIRGAPAEHIEHGPPQSTSPSQARRVSMGTVRASVTQPTIVPQHVVSSSTAAFPRPAYLNYSSLRHFLQTDAQPSTLPSRVAESPSAASSRAQSYLSSVSSDNDDESSLASVPLPTRSSNHVAAPMPQDQVLRLPTRWSEQDRHHNLNVFSDGRELSFQGPSCSGDKEGSSARANHKIPPACGIYYYEVEIMGKEQKAHISIGFAAPKAKFNRLPGADPHSWGYYGEDGSALSPDRNNVHFGPPFGTGDIIGCGIDFSANVAFYTRNGPVFENIGRHGDLYPSVGVQHNGEAIRTNFGQARFSYDIDYHVQQQCHATWSKIITTPIDYTRLREEPSKPTSASNASSNTTGDNTTDTNDEAKDILNQLILSYLVHHGYAQTAKAFSKRQKDRTASSELLDNSSSSKVKLDAAEAKVGTMEDDIESRTNIVNAILEGQIDSAIDTLQVKFPEVLEADNHLIFFKLRCRKFVELILETAEMKKKLKDIHEKEIEKPTGPDYTQNTWASEDMDMDVDDDSAIPSEFHPVLESGTNWNGTGPSTGLDTTTKYESALNEAIVYGQTLSNDYQSDPRPEVQQLFKKTFGIVAWEDPLTAGGATAELVGQGARVTLSHEVNQAILRSQGRPAQPALETLWRHISACITQLGIFGVGVAAFADMERELLQ
ncbi:hypothetical protein D9613_002023 [Agrocybe pediades]|uniref:SPRY-domain-containing protein n=1 Tax=Agrocybe pediades TaxID=84607 RepID=A0A8H4R4F5_9AGAR|nr:hypothetical protein D9613_002023 [Agrocybe pediades]